MYFNSRPHEEVDRQLRSIKCHRLHFNSRPREEVDISYCPRRAGLLLFQLTTSQGGRLIRSVNTANCLYFNSRPHEEVYAQGTDNGRHILISTHNLTRRSTKTTVTEKWNAIFQLTTSRGGRRGSANRNQQCVHISTHDLTRRSTLWSIIYDLILYIFQLTTSRGGRPLFL